MPKGPLGAPRPFVDNTLSLEVHLSGVSVNEVDHVILQKTKQHINGALDLTVGDVGYDDETDIVTVEIKDGRISPKEADAVGEICYSEFRANEQRVIITS